jgi:hypothetical protein
VESLVSDIPAGDGNIANYFLNCMCGIGASVFVYTTIQRRPTHTAALKWKAHGMPLFHSPLTTPFFVPPPPPPSDAAPVERVKQSINHLNDMKGRKG